jgi:hypothetical protein
MVLEPAAAGGHYLKVTTTALKGTMEIVIINCVIDYFVI